MKAKKQEKKEVLPCLNSLQAEPFWRYQSESQEVVQKVDGWFASFDKELKLLVKESMAGAAAELSKAMGVHCHIFYKQREEEQKSGVLDLKNYRFDYPSLKVLLFMLASRDTHTFKFTNNMFEEHCCKALDSFFLTDTKALHVIYDWNAVSSQASIDLVNRFASLARLQSLTLRCCKLGANAVPLLQKVIESQTTALKLLDLNNNELGHDSVPAICKLLKANRSITQLGLGQNSISRNEDIETIFNELGLKELRPEQIAELKELEKQRDEIIEKNKKRKKGTPEEPLPKVPKVSSEGGKFVMQMNMVVECLSLSSNRLKDSAGLAERVLARCPGLTLIYSGNLSSSQCKDLAAKFGERFVV